MKLAGKEAGSVMGPVVNTCTSGPYCRLGPVPEKMDIELRPKGSSQIYSHENSSSRGGKRVFPSEERKNARAIKPGTECAEKGSLGGCRSRQRPYASECSGLLLRALEVQ